MLLNKEIGIQNMHMIDEFSRVKLESEKLVKQFPKTRILINNPLNIKLEKTSSLSLLIKQEKCNAKGDSQERADVETGRTHRE